MSNEIRHVAMLVAFAVGLGASAAAAQAPVDILNYRGPDREQKLIEGARKEGSLSLYTSRVAEDTTPVIEAFTRKYGVEVQVWRGSNRAVLQRVGPRHHAVAVVILVGGRMRERIGA